MAERFFYKARQMSNTAALEISGVIRSISPTSTSENMIVIQRLAAHECTGRANSRNDGPRLAALNPTKRLTPLCGILL
jgi:hypothetical protein